MLKNHLILSTIFLSAAALSLPAYSMFNEENDSSTEMKDNYGNDFIYQTPPRNNVLRNVTNSFSPATPEKSPATKSKRKLSFMESGSEGPDGLNITIFGGSTKISFGPKNNEKKQKTSNGNEEWGYTLKSPLPVEIMNYIQSFIGGFSSLSKKNYNYDKNLFTTFVAPESMTDKDFGKLAHSLFPNLKTVNLSKTPSLIIGNEETTTNLITFLQKNNVSNIVKKGGRFIEGQINEIAANCPNIQSFDVPNTIIDKATIEKFGSKFKELKLVGATMFEETSGVFNPKTLGYLTNVESLEACGDLDDVEIVNLITFAGNSKTLKKLKLFLPYLDGNIRSSMKNTLKNNTTIKTIKINVNPLGLTKTEKIEIEERVNELKSQISHIDFSL